MFKIGDTVKCINNTDYKTELTLNKIYKVIKSKDNETTIRNDIEREYTFYSHRFKLVNNYIEEYGISKFIRSLEKK